MKNKLIAFLITLITYSISGNIFANQINMVGYEYELLINEECKKYQINPPLITALIKIESEFNHLAVSPAGAKGLMQLMPGTAKRFGVNDIFQPEQNIKGGTEYFAFLLERYADVNYALAAYNAGENAVDKYKGIPPYKETINYVKKVVREYKKLTGLTIPSPGVFFIRN